MKLLPVRIPVALAAISAVVVPVSAFAYVGLYAMSFTGLLSIFSTTWIVLDVLLAFLYLLFVWGNVNLLHAVIRTLPELPEKRIFTGLWKWMAGFAGILSVLTPLYSLFPDSTLMIRGWAFAFGVEQVTSILLGCLLMRFALRGRNSMLFAIALALSLSSAFHFGGFRVFQSALDRTVAAEQKLSEELVSGETLLFSLWGLSPSEFDTLDDESLANIQEVSLGVVIACGVGFAGFVVLHTVSSVVFYVLVALYFARKNSPRPQTKWRRRQFKQSEVQIC
ncbi:MAG: hypothetical protein SPL19_03785 [Fibrobacter sp.]|nr:hypothetical protein [Fibrobacter sp.]MDY6370062.1 hypothetical protein [Fibrobacter sp.]MDY6389463.1 hypothetical protein [Fibrobacter sp.]